MLKINNEEYKILSSEIKYANATHNKINGYSILVSLDMEHNNQKGYISFYVDFFDNNDIKNIENKTYKELLTELYSKIDSIEIFDTNNFIDFIDSYVIVEFGKITDNKIEMKFNINDKLIRLEYQGMLDIK